MSSGMVTIVNDELLIVRLSGIIDTGSALALARDLNSVEVVATYPKRLVFVDEKLIISLKSDDVISYKNQRLKPRTVTQTAFCVFTDLQYGIARMFQAILESKQHKIEIFRHRESAAQWLSVDISLLQGQ